MRGNLHFILANGVAKGYSVTSFSLNLRVVTSIDSGARILATFAFRYVFRRDTSMEVVTLVGWIEDSCVLYLTNTGFGRLASLTFRTT